MTPLPPDDCPVTDELCMRSCRIACLRLGERRRFEQLGLELPPPGEGDQR